MPPTSDVIQRKPLGLIAAGSLVTALLLAVAWLSTLPGGASTVEGTQVSQEQPMNPLPPSPHVEELFVSVLAVESPEADQEQLVGALAVESPEPDQEQLVGAPVVESLEADQEQLVGVLPTESRDLADDTAPTAISPAQPLTWTISLPLVANEFRVSPSLFGVDMQNGIHASRGLSQALEAGVHWVRFSAFHWDKIEPERTEPPTYLWGTVDEQSLRNAALNNLEVIAVVQFTPAWAQKVEGLFCGPIHQDRLDEFAQFLQALVARYGGPPYNVRYWELGNEPDVDPSLVSPQSVFGCWGDHDDPYYGGGYYAEMLKVAYPAIKAVDPKAQVLIGGLLLDCDPRVAGACHGVEGDIPPRFLEGILRNEGGPYFDLVSFHAYTYYYDWLGRGQMLNARWPEEPTTIPEKASFLREVLDVYGYGQKPLLNTETALLCPDGTEDCLETQAMYMPRAYAEALALDLKSQIYFSLINEYWNHTGLLLPDLTPKPLYYAYKTASDLLSSTTYSGTAAVYPAGVEGYTFRQRSGGGYLDVIWSEDGTARSIDLPEGANVYDRYGVPIPVSGTLTVDCSPVYVTRP